MKRRSRPALRGESSLIAPEILVQMLAMARTSGCVVFRAGPETCRVYLRDGHILWAELVGRRTGAHDATQPARERVCDALAQALAWRTGSFTFERDVLPDAEHDTLDADPQELLLDCLSRVRTQGGGDEDGVV